MSIESLGIPGGSAQQPGEEWELFSRIADAGYPELAEISKEKPLAILEYGVVDDQRLVTRPLGFMMRYNR